MRPMQREKFWEVCPGVLHILEVGKTKRIIAIWNTNMKEIHRVRRISGCQGMEGGRNGEWSQVQSVFLGGGENVLELDRL